MQRLKFKEADGRRKEDGFLDIISFKNKEAISYCPELPKLIFMESNP